MQPMKARICRSCGVEFELEEAEPRTIYCAACEDLEKREALLIREWEMTQGYLGEEE